MFVFLKFMVMDAVDLNNSKLKTTNFSDIISWWMRANMVVDMGYSSSSVLMEFGRAFDILSHRGFWRENTNHAIFHRTIRWRGQRNIGTWSWRCHECKFWMWICRKSNQKARSVHAVATFKNSPKETLDQETCINVNYATEISQETVRVMW